MSLLVLCYRAYRPNPDEKCPTLGLNSSTNARKPHLGNYIYSWSMLSHWTACSKIAAGINYVPSLTSSQWDQINFTFLISDWLLKARGYETWLVMLARSHIPSDLGEGKSKLNKGMKTGIGLEAHVTWQTAKSFKIFHGCNNWKANFN